MYRELNYTITPEFSNFTVYDYLKSIGYSSKIITHIKKTDMGISVDGKWLYMNNKLKANDVLKVVIKEDASSQNIIPVNLDFEIIYEDEDLMVVNKPTNMPIHPSINNHDNSLANAVAYYFKSQNKNFIFRCINRLDKDTSGLTIIAKNLLSASIMSDMVKKKTLRREYRALVTGRIDNPGQINAPIARANESVIERCVDFENGQEAITNYTPISSGDKYSLLSITLETGRTHQIRVHMAYINHPLPGDFLYNPDYSVIKRQALHSYGLTFNHPITNECLHFISPLPQDMENIVKII